jgi:fanconi anemia group M protein
VSEELRLNILVDRGERHSGVLDTLEEFDDLDIQIKSLPKGDYWIGGDFAVERKTVADLIASIVEEKKRLFNQVRGIKDLGMRPVFIVEGGSLYDMLSGIDEGAIADALSYLAVIEGATVLRSEGTMDTARLLYTMAAHAQRGLGYDVPLRAKPNGDLTTAQQFLVEGLPGIGPALAKTLLQHFNSARALFAADESALCQVAGISKRRADAIRRILDAEYRQHGE